MLFKLAQTKTAHDTNDNADKLESPKGTKLSASESFLRREFKISGQIGEPGSNGQTNICVTHSPNRFRIKAPVQRMRNC